MLNMLTERSARPVVEGVIRLGTRESLSGGRIRNEPYFILKDAPEVAAAYGTETPDAIHIVFPSNDLEQIAHTGLYYWRGVKDKATGKMVSGKKPACYSEKGPYIDGTPGEAIWYDRNTLPPQGDILSERDPATGYIRRVCRGKDCVHWQDDRGRPMCKAAMMLKFYVPMTGYFMLHRCITHSKTSMGEIYEYLRWFVGTQPGGLLGKVFKLYKDSSVITRWDNNSQSETKQVMPILKIKQDREWGAKFGEVVTAKFKQNNQVMPLFLTGSATDQFLPPPFEDSGEEGVDYVDADEDTPAEPVVLTPAQRADLVLSDPEVQEAFGKLETAMGKPLDVRTRQSYVLKKEGEGDVKVAVIDGLTRSTLEILAKNAPQPEPEPEPAPVVEEPAPDAQEPNLGSIDPLPTEG